MKDNREFVQHAQRLQSGFGFLPVRWPKPFKMICNLQHLQTSSWKTGGSVTNLSNIKTKSSPEVNKSGTYILLDSKKV